MVQIIWNGPALEDIEKIRTYITEFDPHAAQRLYARLLAAGNSLVEFPKRGRPAGNRRRELTTVPPYVIRYRVVGDTVYITRIKHGRQR